MRADETHNRSTERKTSMFRDIFDKDGPNMVGMVLRLILMVGFIVAASFLLVR